MRKGMLTGIAVALLALSAGAVRVEAQAITLDEAKKAVAAAEAEARKNNWNLAFLLADADGTPIIVTRMDGASVKNYDVAVRKVRTSLESGMHTVDYGAALKEGKVKEVVNGVTGAGGLVLRRGGKVVGAMSASGARGVEDAQAVRAGMAAIGIQP